MTQQKFWSNQPDQAPPRFQQQTANEGGNNLPPRFKKMILHPQSEMNNGEVSLRPSSNMIFKPKTPSTLPKSATKPPNSNSAGNSNNLNNVLDPIPGGHHNPLSGPPLPHPASGKFIGQTSLLIGKIEISPKNVGLVRAKYWLWFFWRGDVSLETSYINLFSIYFEILPCCSKPSTCPFAPI